MSYVSQVSVSSDLAAELKTALGDVRNFLDALGLLRGATKQAGGFLIRCPWHLEKTPSCSVQVKQGSIVAHCFGCGASGDALDPECAAWLESRAIRLMDVAVRDLARALPDLSMLPRWARYKGCSWFETGHLLVPMFDDARPNAEPARPARLCGGVW